MSKQMHISQFLQFGRGISFLSPTTVKKFQRNPLSGGVKCQEWENSANIAIYLVNGAQ